MSELPEPPKPRRWWLRMLVASAALVAVLLGAVWVTPVARLHYHARQWRKHKDFNQLKAAARILRDRRAHIETVKRLLGPPVDSQSLDRLTWEDVLSWGEIDSEVEGEILFYEGNSRTPAGGKVTGPASGMFYIPPTIELRFDKDNRLAAIYEVTGVARTSNPQPPRRRDLPFTFERVKVD